MHPDLCVKRKSLIPNESIFHHSKLRQNEEVLSLTEIVSSELTCEGAGTVDGIKSGCEL